MRPESERSDWTDTDLLTNTEARERLEEAVRELRHKLDTKRTGGADESATSELRDRLRRFEESLSDMQSS